MFNSIPHIRMTIIEFERTQRLKNIKHFIP